MAGSLGTTAVRIASPVALAAIAVCGIALASDRLLEHQFARAFQTESSNSAVAAVDASPELGPAPAQSVQPSVAAGEEYWLGDARLTPTTKASWSASPEIRVGDRISVSLNGQARELEVVSVRETQADAASMGLPEHQTIVTLRQVRNHLGPAVHLIIGADQRLVPIPGLTTTAREL